MKIIILSILAFPIFANDQVAQCGAKPGFFTDLFTNANHVREICLETLRKENEKKKNEELAQIQLSMKSVDKKLKEVSYKYDYPRVYCEPTSQKRNEKRIKECHELIRSKTALVERMNYLMGWETRVKISKKSSQTAANVELECPSKSELEKIRGIRYFNKKLYQTWEKCVTLKAGGF